MQKSKRRIQTFCTVCAWSKTMVFVDTLAQGSQVVTPKNRKRRRTIKERRDIVEETLVPGTSVARVARRHDVNANQVFQPPALSSVSVQRSRRRSVKDECLSKLILFGERSLKRALHHYELHYHQERKHQGKGNLLLLPSPTLPLNRKQGKVRCRERLGGLLKYYDREAA